MNKCFEKSKFSRGFTLLPTLIILFSISFFVSSILILEKKKYELLEKQKQLFEKELNDKNEKIEKEWKNVFD